MRNLDTLIGVVRLNDKKNRDEPLRKKGSIPLKFDLNFALTIQQLKKITLF